MAHLLDEPREVTVRVKAEPADEFSARVLGFTGPEDSLTLRLPAYMAEEGGHQIVRIGAGFTDVFPGLQVAVFLPAGDEGIIAHFRLTPPDDGHEAPAPYWKRPTL